MVTIVKQYGEMRTGTCWVKHLLERNFDVTVLDNQLGYKHWPYVPLKRWLQYNEPEAPTDDVRYLVVTKSPAAWLLSILDFYSGWPDDRYRNKELLGLLMERWIVAHRSWLGIPGLVHCCYEDLLADIPGELERLGRELGLERKHKGDLRVTKREIGPNGMCCDWDFEARPVKASTYYLDKLYLHRLSDEAWDVLDSLDKYGAAYWSPARFYGYWVDHRPQVPVSPVGDHSFAMIVTPTEWVPVYCPVTAEAARLRIRIGHHTGLKLHVKLHGWTRAQVAAGLDDDGVVYETVNRRDV